MGIFDKIAGFFEDIFGAIGDALSWLLGVPDADDYAGQLINKNSNVANLPVVYGRRLIGGTRVFVSTGGNNKNEYMYIVLALSEGEIQAINSVYVNDKLMVGTPVSGKPYRKVTGGDYKDIIWYQTFTGTDDQTACTTLFNDIGSGPDDFWGVNHRLRGVAYIAMVVKYHQDKGMTSIPEIRCEIQGRKVYDPRTETTLWTSNPALCLRDYLTNERFGKGLPDSAIDDEAFGAAATFCDSTVSSYTGGPSINTFSLNMILDTGNTLFDNTKRFLLAMRGIMPYSEGKYSLIIDKDDASVGTIDESICTRDITIKSVNKNTKLNQVKAVFVNPYKRYEQDSVIWPPADSLEESTFLAEDNNQVLSKDLTLDTVTNFYQARELARVAVLASRSSSIICELVCTSEALKYAVGDIITLEQPSMGWVGPAAKEFRILSIQLAVSGEVGLTLQEYDSSIYPWVTGSEQDDQPETTLPNPNSVDAITTASVSTGSQVLNDGTIQYFADLTWTPPNDELIQDYVVKINKKVGSVTTENVETITTINNKARYILTDTNAQYGYSIQARNGAQVTSEPLTVAPVSVNLDTTAPADITSLNATGKLQQIELKWVNPTDPDFDVVYVKVSDTTTEPTEIFAKVKSDTFTHEVGAYSTTKYYWVAPVDSSGNIGNYTGPESATTGSIGIGDIPHVAGTFYLTLGDNDAPTNAEFAGAVGRNPIVGDVAVVNKAYFFTRGASAWTAVTEFIDGSLLVSDSITTTQINTDSVLAESILANTANITGDLTVTSGKITVQDTDTVINLDPDAQYPFRISQGTEDVVRLGSSTLDPFIKGAFIRGMPVQSINEADLTTFVRNVVGVTSEEKTETETLTHLPTGGNLVYLEADNITTGLTTVLTLESVAGTQSWVYEYADESDWDSGDSAFFNYTLQGYNGTAWEDISGWVNRPVFASGYRISGALVGWSISETYSRTIENNTYTHFRMVVGNMSGEFGGGLHPTSTGINCDFKLTSVTGSQVNSDNYADSFSINDTSGVLTIGRTGSLGDLTADISTYVGNQVSALVDSAPSTLDTLNELAQALGDDPNFATTVTTSIGTKWTQDNTKIANWDTAYGWGNHASAGYLTSIPSEYLTQTEGDSRYQQSDGLHKRFYKSNGNTGAVWYKLGNFPNSSGFLQITGTIGSHVESFGTSRLDLTIYAREGGSGANVSIDGKFEVAHQGTGLQVYRKDNDGGYESYDIWLKVGNYAQVCIDLNYVNFTYDGTSTTTQPDTSGYFATEIDTTTYGQGSYDVEASAVYERYNSGVFTNNSSNWDTAYGWGNHSDANYIVGGGTWTGGSGSSYTTLAQSVFASGNTKFTFYGTDGKMDVITDGEFYANEGGSRVFHDTYHPNADKWTTARSHTVTLTGEVTGTATQSVDGTGNRTWSIVTTLNDSALDDQYVTVGSRYTGNADVLVEANKASIRQWDISTASDAPSGTADGLVLSAGWDYSSWGVQQYHDFHNNSLYLRSKQNGTFSSWDKVFADNYHPNADKWTTARTLSLTGDVTGSVSWDGSANASISATVVNDSHTHDGRYYTESESNTRYLNRVSSIESNLDTKYDADLFGFSPSTTGRPENYGQGISIVSSGNTHNNSNNWITQLAFGTSNNSMYFRGKVNAGSWGSWRTVFHSGNLSTGSDTRNFGAVQINGTTVIDSSRNITANSFTQSGASGNSLYAISLTRGGTHIWSSQTYLRLGTSSSRQDLNITDTATSINVMNGYQTEGVINIGRSDGTARYHSIYAYNDGTTGNNYLKFNVHNGSTNSTTNALTLWGDGQAEISSLKVANVGGIKQAEGEFGIGSGGVGLHFNNSGSNVLPYSYSTNDWTNGVTDFGHPSYRYKDGFFNGKVSVNTLEVFGNSIVFANFNDSITYEDTGNVFSFNADNSTGNAPVRAGSYQVGTATVIDASRNLSVGRVSALTDSEHQFFKVTNAGGVSLRFSDQSSHAQSGYLKYFHSDSVSHGSGNAFTLTSTEASLSFAVDGKVISRDGFYVGFSSANNGTQVIDSSRNLTNIASIKTSGDIIASGATPWIVIENTEETQAGIRFGDFQAGAYPAGSSQAFQMTYDSGAGNLFRMGHDNDTDQFTLDTSGNVSITGNMTAYGSSSDITLKENISSIDNALDKVSKVNGVTFNYIGDENKMTGVIAQEVQKVLPEAVYTTDDDKLAVRYGNMVGLLIEAIKELKCEIEELKNVNGN